MQYILLRSNDESVLNVGKLTNVKSVRLSKRTVRRMYLFQINTPHFCAGIILSKDKIVIDAAPIVRYMIGWSSTRVYNYCMKKHWTVDYVG